ncbi:hypothetical protein, partial [Streptomyces sp. NPDC051364]|uniref:hypothetical protein n=1 Tax=Streptomyces sp. NPDC051364 TaxID=3155799 RepID=UPI003427D22F
RLQPCPLCIRQISTRHTMIITDQDPLSQQTLAPGATKNVVWERFQPAGAGPRAAVTTIRFRNTELARAEIRRLHESLLHCAGERYSYDGGLLSVIRSH